MEKIKKFQKLIADTLGEYAQSNVPGMEDQLLLDYKNNHFQLVSSSLNLNT